VNASDLDARTHVVALPRWKRQFDTSQVSRSEHNHELGKATAKCEKVQPLYENAPLAKRSVDGLTRTDTHKQTETENGKYSTKSVAKCLGMN